MKGQILSSAWVQKYKKIRNATLYYRRLYFDLWLSGKIPKSINILPEAPQKLEFEGYFFKSKPPNQKELVLVALLHLLCKDIIPCLLQLFHKCDKIDIVHKHKTYHGIDLRECTMLLNRIFISRLVIRTHIRICMALTLSL